MIWGKLFGSGEPDKPAAELPVVHQITIGRTVELDTLIWRRLTGAAFTLDRGTLEIVAQGRIELDDAGGYVHRFYTEDELMLQAVSQSPDGHDADDLTLFMPWSSHYPRPGEEAAFVQTISQPVFDLHGVGPYQRFWYDGDEGVQPPVTLWETVWDDRTMARPRHIQQRCMLYARELGADRELLLAISTRPERGDATLDLMVGVPVTTAEFTV